MAALPPNAARRPAQPVSPPSSFIALCLAGRAQPSEAHAYIERWNREGQDGTPLPRYLGMSDAEWSLYLEGEGNLLKILDARRIRHYPAEAPSRRADRL